jgi:hypothetical protein
MSVRSRRLVQQECPVVRVLAHLALVAAIPLAGTVAARAAQAQAPNEARAAWTPIARTAAVTASIDTTRMERTTDGAARLWYRFAFATPLALGDAAASRFEATEMRMEVDCRGQRVRTLTLRMESTEGVQADVPASDSAWRTFAAHPMGAGIFVPACAALGVPLPAPSVPSSASSPAAAAKP